MTPYVTLAIVLVAFGVLGCGAAVLITAVSLLRPPRMTDGKAAWVLKRLSPGDLGLNFEDIYFNVRDEWDGAKLRLAAWWIPGPAVSERCVVLLHGYADAKVGAIAWAPVWHAMGFHVLAIDLRAHGESGGTFSTAGFRERHDMVQAIHQIRAERPAETRRMVLFGVSLGAAVAAAVGAICDDVNAVVLESPYADFRHAAMIHLRRLGLPGGPFPSMAVRLAERLSGARFAEVRPVQSIPKIACPVMVISPDSDPLVGEEDRAALQAALKGRGRPDVDVAWRVTDAGHLLALHADPAAYERRLREFLRGMIPAFEASERNAM